MFDDPIRAPPYTPYYTIEQVNIDKGGTYRKFLAHFFVAKMAEKIEKCVRIIKHC